MIELTNISPKPESSYLIQTQIIHDLLLEGAEYEEVVIWHTHPKGNVGPSKGDMENRIEGVKYLVISLPEGQAVRF